jgi:hypothetical protein
MADIAKCNDNLCPSKYYCHRFTAPIGIYQTYGIFNREDDAENCDMFWPNGKCKYCHKENNIHRMSCPTQKIQVNLSFKDKP